jgi:iron-sulfur cluster repair protein YtfE (RIC family)
MVQKAFIKIPIGAIVAFRLLKQFENNLHIHALIENNILFPKALQLTTKSSKV